LLILFLAFRANAPPPSITLGLYLGDPTCSNNDALYEDPIIVASSKSASCVALSGWYISCYFQGTSITVEYHQSAVCSDAAVFTSTFPPGVRCEPLLEGGQPSGYYVSDMTASPVTALTIALSQSKVKAGTTVTVTSVTTPVAANIVIQFKDKVTGNTLGSGTTNANGVASTTITSSSAAFYQTQAVYQSLNSVALPLLFRGANGVNAYNDYGNAASGCHGTMWFGSTVVDESGNLASGTVEYFANNGYFGGGTLQNGEGPLTPADPLSDISVYYDGSTVGSNIISWFVCK